MTSRHEQTGALEAIDRILNRGGEADDVLRDVLAVLGRLYRYVAVEFVEGDRSVVGPELGKRDVEAPAFPVVYQGRRIGALLVAGAPEGDRPFLERVATLVSAYVLVGWDTGGVPWSPD